MSQRFDALRESLLRAGIAPRHVKRYLRELSDHFDDLFLAEVANGLPEQAAEAAAKARLGSDEALAAPMLAKPELRSLAARYPLAMFGLGPVVTLAASVMCALWLELGLILSLSHLMRHYAWHIEPYGPAAMLGRRAWDVVFSWLPMYVAPLAIAAVLCASAVKQRIEPRWIVLGLAVICVIGGFHEIGIKWSYTHAQPSELDVGLGVVDPFLGESLWTCLLRVAANAVFTSGIYWLLQRREFRHAAV